MTDRKIMTSAAAIFAATFATASLAQDALNNPAPGLGADAGQVQMDTSPEAGGLGGGEMDTTGTGTGIAAGTGTGAGVGGTTGVGTTDLTDGAGIGTVGGNAGTMTQAETAPAPGDMGTGGASATVGATSTPGADAMGGAGAAGGVDTAGTGGAYGGAGANAAGGTNTAGDMGAAGGQNDWTFGSLMTGMQGNADFSAELDAIDESTEVQVVRLSQFQGTGAEGAQSFDDALEQQQEALTASREAVRENPQVTQALEAEEFDADDVVTVRWSAEGTLEVIVDDRDA